ncbi:MAG: GspE/PulE family protein [Phycisphaerales bacterium]
MQGHDDFVIASMVESGALDREGLASAQKHAGKRGVGLCEAITELGLLSHREVALYRAEVSEYAYVELSDYEVDIGNVSLLPKAIAEQHTAIVLFLDRDGDGPATVAMENPLDLRAVDQIRSVLRREIELVLCDEQSLRGLIGRAYALAGDGEEAGARPGADPESLTTGREPIVAAVNQIIAQGIELGASDIHINPDENVLRLRYRVDGALQEARGPGLSAHAGLVQRLKVMAGLDLTQTRRPQDGKFRFSHGGRATDIRLSLIPTVCGENVVMRVLTSGANIRDFASLGFPTEERGVFERIIESPYGMLLVTGPTGSGKTTTLYTALKRINTPDKNILTIEDPVEIRMPMIRQVQVHAEIGMTFAGALRSVLRQDPDVVFVGEIRDEETARISLQAALTGHLVLSSLHTNDAAGAVPRLRDLGCPGFAINAALLAVIGQRLVRRTCPHCVQPSTPDAAVLARFGASAGEGWVSGAGCGRCGSTGYQGRIGIYELLRMSARIGAAVERGASSAEVQRTAVEEGMRLMWQDGLEKARVGLTTLEEVNRTVAVQATGTGIGSPPDWTAGRDDRKAAA